MSQSGDKLSLGERLRYGAEAGVFFAFMTFFKLLGPETASRIGGWIGRNLLSLLPPDRVARANLAAAFPEKSAQERNAIRRAMWDNLGRVVGEYPHLDRFSPHGEDPRITYSLPQGMTVDGMKNKPLMFLSAHLGNWEVMPILAHQEGLEGAAVVRPPNNPFVADWVARQRRINGPDTLIAKHNAVRAMLGQLRSGKMLCMLVDQKLREGIAVPFFGRDAMTTPAPAVLALKTGAQLVFASNQRLPGPRFHVTVWPDINFVPTGNEAEDSRALTAAITLRIEEMIRADPGQWLWIYNRWPTERDRKLMEGEKRVSTRQRILDTLFFGRDPLKDFPAERYTSDLQGWHSDHAYLSRAIEEARPQVVVEVGVWKGASVVTMAKAMQKSKLDAVVIAIDTWLGSSEHYLWEKFIPDLDFEFGYPRLYHKFAANICKEGLADYVVPLPLDSINAFQLLKERGIRPDVLHIDAGHDYLSVMADLKGWWPQLNPGGVLIGDDYFKKPILGQGKWPEVRQAFDEFFATTAHTKFESGDGKCYVGKPAGA